MQDLEDEGGVFNFQATCGERGIRLSTKNDACSFISLYSITTTSCLKVEDSIFILQVLHVIQVYLCLIGAGNNELQDA